MPNDTPDPAVLPDARALIRDWRELVRLENIKARDPNLPRDAIDMFQSDMYTRWPAWRVDEILSALATPPASDAAVPAEEDTVAFVQEWLMNADYDPTKFDRDFAAAIDARVAAAAPKVASNAGRKVHDPALETSIYGECPQHGRYARIAPCCSAATDGATVASAAAGLREENDLLRLALNEIDERAAATDRQAWAPRGYEIAAMVLQVLWLWPGLFIRRRK